MEKHILSPDFVSDLEFSYLETYSLLRGNKNWEFNFWLDKEILSLTKAQLVNYDPILSERLKTLDFYNRHTQFLKNEKGELHPTSEQTHKLSRSDSKVERLLKILSVPVLEQMEWMCAPIYRDAVIFYDNDGRQVCILNICLSCEYMQLQDRTFIDADVSAYQLLRNFFVELGHDLENDGVEDE